MNPSTDTIAAIATAPGRGSVGIIRLSGPACKIISQQMTERELIPRYAHFGNFLHPQTQAVLDQGLAIFFAGPNSFTGEDVLELQGHGGPVVMDQILEAVTSVEGVRLAKPGEFSERAFLNDKLDLAQAEAIADLINANSEQAARNAVHSLQGVFSDRVHEIVQKLTHLRLYVEAAIDFPEEEIDFLSDSTITSGIENLIVTMETLLKEAQQGVILQEGMNVVIAGKPNAGKSSLLNALAGRDTAIVTDIPGTTRDLLREHINLDGMPLHIIDTAGLRDSGDQVEQMGMQRAWAEIDKADRILLLVDASQPITEASLQELIPQFGRENADKSIDQDKITLILNKSDLVRDLPVTRFDNLTQLTISAKTGDGLSTLKEHLKAIMGYQQVAEGGFTARRRHIDALNRAQDSILLAQDQLEIGAGELVAEELRQAQHSLGEITGVVTADDLLGHIFSSFCIGK